MGARFSRGSDEEICGKTVVKVFGKKKIKCACLRTAEHPGECVAMSYDAAKADGVCYGCRQKVWDEHRKGCDAIDFLVECAFCYERFPPAVGFVSYMDGLNCSSSICSYELCNKGKVSEFALLNCGYGSEYDFEQYRFVDGVPIGYANASTVCDGCIRGFIEQGVLEKVPYIVGVSIR